jgi:hypothetical protein
MLNAPRQDFASPVRAVDTITASVMVFSCVILRSEATKNLLSIEKQILRFAQDDRFAVS